MGAISLDSFENNSFEKIKYEITDKLEELNNSFKSGVKAVEGKFGPSQETIGDSVTKKIGRNELGNAVKEFFYGDKLISTVENLGNGISRTTSFDDNGTAFLKETVDSVKNTVKYELTPNVKVVKGNFSAEIDQLGRVVKSRITDIELKESGARNDSKLNSLKKDLSYKLGDEKGHLIPDSFDGPATRENITAQDAGINKGLMKKVENIARKMKQEGHKVDYELKSNFVGSKGRASSFEPKIFVDGIEHELPKELQKIYNESEITTIKKVITNVGEKVGLNHEAGIESAKFAAGITCTISTVDNVRDCIKGKISPGDAACNIAKDTGISGAIGYGVGFVSKGVSSAMVNSSHQLIKSLGKTGVPAAVVSFAVESFDDVVDFAQGDVGLKELTYDLGENAVGIAGSIGGTALAGAAMGSIIPGAGNVIGAAVGVGVGFAGGMAGYVASTGAYEKVVDIACDAIELAGEVIEEHGDEIIEKVENITSDVVDTGAELVGDFVGYAVTCEAYVTVVDAVEAAGEKIDEYADELEELGDKAKDIADDAISKAADLGDAAVENVKDAITNFNLINKLPF